MPTTKVTQPSAPVTRSGWRGSIATLRTRFRAIFLVPPLLLIVLMGWALASPIGAAPDDDFHLTSTWCANGARTDLCEPGPTSDERIVPPAVLYAPCFAQDAKVSASCQARYVDEGPTPSVDTHRGNFANNYPPVYYAVMNVFAGPDILGSAFLMRVFNILLFVGFTTALYLLLPAMRRPSLVWGWLITTVPLGFFLIASNNPSSWAIMGVGFSWLALLGFVESTGKRKIALGAIFAVTGIMASGARGDAAIYTILGIAVVAALTFRRDRRWLLDAILPAVIAIAAVLFFVSSQQSSVVAEGLGTGVGQHGTTVISDPFALLVYNLISVQALWAGVFGSWGLGWLDTSLPAIVSLGGLAVFVAVAFIGIGIHSWRKTLSIVGLAVVLWLLPTYILVKGGNIVGQNVQPRYLLPLIVIMGGLAVLAVAGRQVRFGGFQSFFIILTLAMAQSLSLHLNMRRYITGTDVQGWNLDANVEWWWGGAVPPPMVVWFVGSLAFTALITILMREMAKAHAVVK